mmetsp:Transcript_36989/g.95948  ORF Transcript_36989/g.95948 Transcript_36989/m.95948 type:complete len:307 (-) Transcript_36989:173-1093(-)
MYPGYHPLPRRQDPAAGPAGNHRGRQGRQGPRPAGHLHRAHVQPDRHRAGLPEARDAQEAHRARARGLWHPAEQAAAGADVQEKGQGRPVAHLQRGGPAAGPGRREGGVLGVPHTQRRRPPQGGLHRGRAGGRDRGQPHLHPLHLRRQQGGPDHAGGAQRAGQAAALLPRVRVPRVEPGRPDRDVLGLPRPAAHLHQAQGQAAGLQRPRRAPQGPEHGGGLLQPHPQGHSEAVQVRSGVGLKLQAPAAARRQGARARGRGHRPDRQENLVAWWLWDPVIMRSRPCSTAAEYEAVAACCGCAEFCDI